MSTAPEADAARRTGRRRASTGRDETGLRARRRWTQELGAQVPSARRIGVVALRPGIGRTSTALLVGAALARARTDDVVLVDTDGRAARRSGAPSWAGLDDFAALGDPGSLDVVHGVVGRTPEGLWVLPPDGSSADPLDAERYVPVMNALYRHWPVMLTVCPPGLDGPLTRQVLRGCHALVLVAAPDERELLGVAPALDWLQGAGYPGLGAATVVAVAGFPGKSAAAAVQAGREALEPRCREVVAVPVDPVIGRPRAEAAGPVSSDAAGPVTWTRLRPATRRAATRIAAAAFSAAVGVG